MNADLLRRAASRLRDQATAASPDDWHPVYDGTGWLIRSAGYTVAVVDPRSHGEYIALMHPPVALAMADWLDTTAVYYDYSYDENADLSEMDDCSKHAIITARAILREEVDRG